MYTYVHHMQASRVELIFLERGVFLALHCNPCNLISRRIYSRCHGPMVLLLLVLYAYTVVYFVEMVIVTVVSDESG